MLEAISEDGRARIVDSAEILCSGERFRLEVEVRYRSFVYVALGRDHKATVLYPVPSMSPLRLSPGRVHRLPDDMDFELDGRPGTEHIFVLASEHPLQQDAIKRVVTELLRHLEPAPKPLRDRICAVGGREVASGQPAPDGALERYRDIVLRQRLGSRSIADANTVHITILHR